MLSTALQILSNFCDNTFAALTATWKRGSDLLFDGCIPPRQANTYFRLHLVCHHDLTSMHTGLLTQILQPPPPPPIERLTLEIRTAKSRSYQTFCLVSLLILATSTMETLQQSILTGYHLGFHMACYSSDSTNQHMYQYAYQKRSTHVPPSTSRR